MNAANKNCTSHATDSISSYFGEYVFDCQNSPAISPEVKKQLLEMAQGKKLLPKELADIVGKAVLAWAMEKGATHFCHWFQPLTEGTAEKHDSFLTLKDSKPIEKLSGSVLMQGEPDASSFPHGGMRSTFEARGYTAWDISSPMFISVGPHGRTLYIPTGFVSYLGDALDHKTPLIRAMEQLNIQATTFLHQLGHKDVSNVTFTVGAEQEFFLIDRKYYLKRPDLIMTGRTLVGALAPKNQQLEDHYFGHMEDRVLGMIQEFEIELYKMGVPIKTRHNEVSPGQYEIAPIFKDANISCDQNQLIMSQLDKVARKHGFMVLLHEKPFSKVNGSGKHMNWSMQDNFGRNLLDPSEHPEKNTEFLAFLSIVLRAVYEHAGAIRMSIAGHGNDFRLGGNEAPPSIISIFLGDVLTNLLKNCAGIVSANNTKGKAMDNLAIGLAPVCLDNSDRNRTSPFAFTGNKFEFRAVGSSASVGFPATIVCAAISDALSKANTFIKSTINQGKSIEASLLELIRVNYLHSSKIIFNGDGYDQLWVEEAQKRGLPILSSTPQALAVLTDAKATNFLSEQKILSQREITIRHNVFLERFVKKAHIELLTLIQMLNQEIIPSVLKYKITLLQAVNLEFSEDIPEFEIMRAISKHLRRLYKQKIRLEKMSQKYFLSQHSDNEGHLKDLAIVCTDKIIPHMKITANIANELENLTSHECWSLPKYYEMLCIR